MECLNGLYPLFCTPYDLYPLLALYCTPYPVPLIGLVPLILYPALACTVPFILYPALALYPLLCTPYWPVLYPLFCTPHWPCRFFATESLDDDLTPTDADSEQLKPFSRRLYDDEDLCDEIKPPSPPPAPAPVTSGSCLRKRLFPSAISEKLSKYAFGGSKSKRQRIEGQDQGEDIPVAKPIRSNPFAIVSSQNQSLSRPDTDAITSDSEEHSEWRSQNDVTVECDRLTISASENRCDLSSTTTGTSSHGGTSRKVFCRNEENTPVMNPGLGLSHSTLDPIGDDTDCMSVLKDIPHNQESMNTQPTSSYVERKHQKALTNPVCHTI